MYERCVCEKYVCGSVSVCVRSVCARVFVWECPCVYVKCVYGSVRVGKYLCACKSPRVCGNCVCVGKCVWECPCVCLCSVYVGVSACVCEVCVCGSVRVGKYLRVCESPCVCENCACVGKCLYVWGCPCVSEYLCAYKCPCV